MSDWKVFVEQLGTADILRVKENQFTLCDFLNLFVDVHWRVLPLDFRFRLMFFLQIIFDPTIFGFGTLNLIFMTFFFFWICFQFHSQKTFISLNQTDQLMASNAGRTFGTVEFRVYRFYRMIEIGMMIAVVQLLQILQDGHYEFGNSVLVLMNLRVLGRLNELVECLIVDCRRNF